MGDLSRSVALHLVFVLLIGTLVGSVLPEFGNLLAQKLRLWSHTFNVVFLAVGIVGIGVALYFGYRSCI